MISVVCVYNNRMVLERCLLSSLERQNTRCDVVTVDNRDSAYDSAASALNHGAEQATGDWVLFVHQDVALISQNWLARAEDILERDSPKGWVGVVGLDTSGKLKGFMVDRAHLLGHPFDALSDVQTLDECLLVHRRLPQGQKYFDESLKGWHAYGVDACCAALRAGRKNYVIPLPIWHDSPSTNLSGLAESHEYVWHKHKSALKRIHTTCGTLPDDLYGRVNTSPSLSDRIKYRWRRINKRLYDIDGTDTGWFADALESLTLNEQVIECLHRPASEGNITARAFLPLPACNRVIHHRFSGLNTRGLESDCVIIAPDLAYAVPDETELVNGMVCALRRLIVCVGLGQLWRRPVTWRKLARLADTRHLTTSWGDARILIFQFGNETNHQS
jgi:hypothetical protein